jgi:hypothetical protein
VVITAEDKLREVERELKLRRRLYPHWIEIGRIEAGDAKRRIDILVEIAADREAGAKRKDCCEPTSHHLVV